MRSGRKIEEVKELAAYEMEKITKGASGWMDFLDTPAVCINTVLPTSS